jgi:anthranilate phosphoribosyltransferase
MTSPIITEATRVLVDRRDLTRIEAAGAMEAIMSGTATDAQIAAFLTALRMKGETVEELIGFAQVMRQKVVRIRTRADEVAALTGTDREMLIDTCGTGGDATGTFNVSTATAFVVAGAGLKVAKHGNRSVSSRSGSADVLEALGAKLDLAPEQIAQAIETVGVGFMFAPSHHPAMKHAAPVRKELGVRTIFNILGPLTNPAGAQRQLMGVFHPDLVGIQTRVLQRLGAKHVMVVYGKDGLDEISISGETAVGELANGEIREYELHPSQFGLEVYDRRAIQVNSVDESRQMILAVLENQPGPALNIVLLNAGAALYVAGVAKSLAEGIDKAREAVGKGKARQKLDDFLAFTKKHAKA